MSFQIQRQIGSTLIRFGVAPDRNGPDSDQPLWSTGPDGQYRPLSPTPLFYREESDDLSLAREGHHHSGRWSGLRGLPIVSIVTISVGVVLILLGVLVLLLRNDAIGWIEVVLGVIIIVVPWLLSARKRRQARADALRREEERAAEEERRRELIGDYVHHLEQISFEADTEELERIREERTSREIPPEALLPVARDAVHRAGFGAIAAGRSAGEVGSVIARIGDAVGLGGEEIRQARLYLYQKLVWHLLADSRCDRAHRERLEELARGLDLTPDELERERNAVDQLERVKGLKRSALPEVRWKGDLRFQEVCHHSTPAATLDAPRRWGSVRSSDSKPADLVVSSRRILYPQGKLSIPLDQIYEIAIDADRNELVVTRGGRKPALHHFVLEDPIFTAGIIEAARQAPRKPAGLL